jgi:uncharacterized membrane protein YdbT with pleckstrin-like domain
MRMQEPEQQQPFGRQASQESSEYSAAYTGRYESEQQQEYNEEVARDNYQQEKLHPLDERRRLVTTLGILAIILSSIGFFLAVAGIVVSSIVLKYANGQPEWLPGGIIGLVVSIVILIVCVAFFVAAVVTLAVRARRVRRRMGARL